MIVCYCACWGLRPAGDVQRYPDLGRRRLGWRYEGGKSAGSSFAMVVYFFIAVNFQLQATYAQSSGGSEFYALGAGCADGLYAQSILNDMGISLNVAVFSDASSAIAQANRQGLSNKLRHVHVQSLVKHMMINVKKINTHAHRSNMGAKRLPVDRLGYFRAMIAKQNERETQENQTSVNIFVHEDSVNLVEHVKSVNFGLRANSGSSQELRMGARETQEVGCGMVVVITRMMSTTFVVYVFVMWGVPMAVLLRFSGNKERDRER